MPIGGARVARILGSVRMGKSSFISQERRPQGMRHIPMVSLRLVREGTVPYQSRQLENARTVYEVFRDLAEDLDREAMWVVCLM